MNVLDRPQYEVTEPIFLQQCMAIIFIGERKACMHACTINAYLYKGVSVCVSTIFEIIMHEFRNIICIL